MSVYCIQCMYVEEYPHVMTRVLKTLTMDVSSMELVCKLANLDNTVVASVHEYAKSFLLPFFEDHCTTSDIFEHFLSLLCKHVGRRSQSSLVQAGSQHRHKRSAHCAHRHRA